MKKGSHKKEIQLGMSWTTATGRLTRLVLFQLVQKTSQDICFRCNEKILTIEELSIEHKNPWLDVSPSLFWDLENIAFSHSVCNKRAGRKPTKWLNGRKQPSPERRKEISKLAHIGKRKKFALTERTLVDREILKREEVRGYKEQHSG